MPWTVHPALPEYVSGGLPDAARANAPALVEHWGACATTVAAPAGTWHVRVVTVADTGSTVDVDAVTLEAFSARQ